MSFIFSKIYIGSDHGGFETKEFIKKILKEKKDTNFKLEDVGTHNLESVDYPIFAKKVCNKIQSQIKINKNACGILICTTGIGMSITANKFANIRAALCHDINSAKMSRLHNNANILVLKGKNFNKELYKQILFQFLTTEFSNEERHLRRIEQIKSFEKSQL